MLTGTEKKRSGTDTTPPRCVFCLVIFKEEKKEQEKSSTGENSQASTEPLTFYSLLIDIHRKSVKPPSLERETSEADATGTAQLDEAKDHG